MKSCHESTPLPCEILYMALLKTQANKNLILAINLSFLCGFPACPRESHRQNDFNVLNVLISFPGGSAGACMTQGGLHGKDRKENT